MRTPDRRGFTLLESMVVLLVMGLLCTLSWPRVRGMLIQSDVKSARSAVISSYQQGRSRALQDARHTTIWFGQHNVWVTANPRRTACAGCTYDTVGVVYNLTQRYGVSIAATPDTFVELNARGLGLSTNNTTTVIALVKSGVRDTVRINQIGRVTK